MDSGQSTRTEPSASGWSCACPAEAARLPFSSARNATTSLRGRWGSARQRCGRPAPVPAGQAAPAPPHLDGPPAPGCSRHPVRRGQLALGAPGKDPTRRTEGKDPRCLSLAVGVLFTPGPRCFSEGWGLPDACAGPHRGTAVSGAHPGRDPRGHRLPRPGRSAGPRGAWIRPFSAAAAAGSCIPQSPVGSSGRLAEVTVPASPRTRHPTLWVYRLLLQSK